MSLADFQIPMALLSVGFTLFADRVVPFYPYHSSLKSILVAEKFDGLGKFGERIKKLKPSVKQQLTL